MFEEGVAIWYNLDSGGSIEATITMQCRRQYVRGKCVEAVVDVVRAEKLHEMQFLSEQDPYVRATILNCSFAAWCGETDSADAPEGSKGSNAPATVSRRSKMTEPTSTQPTIVESPKSGSGAQMVTQQGAEQQLGKQLLDTYVVSDAACTEVKRGGGKNPVWKKSLRLRAGRLARAVKLEVWNKNSMLLADELIGSATVSFDDEILLSEQCVWIMLRPKGRLMVSVYFEEDSEAEAAAEERALGSGW